MTEEMKKDVLNAKDTKPEECIVEADPWERIVCRADLASIGAELQKCKGYMFGITMLTNDNKLVTYQASSNFPRADYLSSNRRLRDLLIKELEKDVDDFDDKEM